ncbi:MAG: class I poly(R)-hydroxyalkanoic acid synthase, partial [Alphaproteobacteria bacterium]
MTADPATLQAELATLGERTAALLGKSFLTRLDELAGQSFLMTPPDSVNRSFGEFGLQLLADPHRLATAQARLWRDSFALWHKVLEGRRLGRLEPLYPTAPGDRRFKDKAWQEEPGWTYLQQSYFLLSHWLSRLVDDADLDPATHRRVKFYTRQYLSAMAPSNFPLTNPEVLRRAQETEGRSLVDGLERFLDDLERGDGHLRVRMTDEAAFTLGENLATSPGKVVFRNELMELIQYAATTATAHRRPLLLVPPWINKFYILDLQENNSFVKYAVDQGFTVFLISWVNPSAELADRRFEDYLRLGPLAALAAIEAAIGEREVNVLGFCIGGILTATLLSHLAAAGDPRVTSATFLATLFDFTEVGEIGIFVDEPQVAAIERHTAAAGVLEGRHMADMFSMLKENDLLWSFFVNNYLLGKDPEPFDLLYWNGDATRLPAAMLSDYLRGFYLGNALARPGTLNLLGRPVDTRRVDVPAYALATKEDHIAPWTSCWPVMRQFRGPVRFVLGGSGHIAGVISPPSRRKYGYWTREEPAASARAWLDGATPHDGSWWSDWASWLARRGGGQVPARDPAAGG